MMRIILMVILISASIAGRSEAAESEAGSALPATQRVTLKWLGTAGWEIQFAQTKILIDPFLTRKQSVAGEEWKTDEEAVLNVIITHDDWRVPLSSGMTAAVRRRAQRLERDVKSVDRNIKVIIPEFLQTITLE
jgi:hypothetical protein